MAKRRKQKSYDIRPKSARIRKSWASLSSSGKTYWRSKLDVRPRGVRRSNPLDRYPTATARAVFTREQFRTPYQQRVVRETGIRYVPPREFGGGDVIRRIEEPDRETKDKVSELREEPLPYGYDIDDFKNRSSFPPGYSYVLYHLFWNPAYKGQGQVVTYRGGQYNTPEEAIAGYEGEVDEISESEAENAGSEDLAYIRTVVAVIPASGAERVGGAVYPEDYHPKERPGTREYEIEEGKRRLGEFGPPLKR